MKSPKPSRKMKKIIDTLRKQKEKMMIDHFNRGGWASGSDWVFNNNIKRGD